MITASNPRFPVLGISGKLGTLELLINIRKSVAGRGTARFEAGNFLFMTE